jgi:hypothetical protein
MKYSWLFLLLAALPIWFLTLIFTVTPAGAVDHGGLARAHQVAFAYYKLSNQELDIAAIIRNDPSFIALSPLDQVKLFPVRRNQLQEEYKNFTPQMTPLRVKSPINVLASHQDRSLRLVFAGGKPPYFPFAVNNRIITLFAEDLTNYLNIPLVDDLAVRRAQYLIKGPSELVLDLIPTRNLLTTSVVIDDVPQYPILARIARLRLQTTSGVLIWAYQNPAFSYLDRGPNLRLLK